MNFIAPIHMTATAHGMEWWNGGEVVSFCPSSELSVRAFSGGMLDRP